ncbi:MAG: hypothetical protein AAB728_04745 [Patescibacteria group bacterium]
MSIDLFCPEVRRAETPSLKHRIDLEVLDAFREAAHDDVSLATPLDGLPIDSLGKAGVMIAIEDNCDHLPELRGKDGHFMLPDGALERAETIADMCASVHTEVERHLKQLALKNKK